MSQADHRAGAADPAMNEAVDLDPARKREILEMERGLTLRNHFEILGLSPGASAEEVKRAFHEASRRFHPDRYFGKELGSFKGRLERIFRRLSEANSVLSDPARREAWLKERPELAAAERARGGASAPPAAPTGPEDEARAAERRARMARHPYLAQARKVGDMLAQGKAAMEQGDFARAYTHLLEASKLDPKSKEIPQLLGEARRKQEVARSQQELQQARELEAQQEYAKAAQLYRSASATDSQNPLPAARAAALMLRLGEDVKQVKLLAQKAVDLDPNNAGYRVVLGKALVAAGMARLAKREFEKAIERDPNHAEAKEQLKKLRWTF